jgi:hypothetical protein
MGGLLASYGSLAEQKEVEDWFISRGFMLPQYQRLYWIGLRTPAYKGSGSLSKFAWLDGSTPAPGATTYSRWGGQPGLAAASQLVVLMRYLPACTGAAELPLRLYLAQAPHVPSPWQHSCAHARSHHM